MSIRAWDCFILIEAWGCSALYKLTSICLKDPLYTIGLHVEIFAIEIFELLLKKRLYYKIGVKQTTDHMT